MKRTRVALLITVLGVTALGLAACEKPNPGASVFSGTTTKWREAACWAQSGSIDANACAQEVISKATSGAKLAEVPVVPGQVVGISVDPVVADTGWFPRINGQNLTQSPITSTYYRFTFPEFQQIADEGLTMEIVAGADDATRGIWLFQLVPAS